MSHQNLNEILNDIADRFLIALDNSFSKLFSGLNPELWFATNHNPIKFLRNYQDKIITYESYEFDINYLIERYDSLTSIKLNNDKTIAYFSPEFGFHESFPNYAGGLGILAGDVIKIAAETGTNICGIGLLYSKGYFKQTFRNGKQCPVYKELELNDLPISPLKDSRGNNICINLDVGAEIIKVIAYKLKLLNSDVILLSTDDSENGKLRIITDNLYTGDRNLRLLQEIVLGFGGVKVLEEMGLDFDVLHVNEGHAAFAFWAKASEYSRQMDISIEESIDILRVGNVFTTHTPVIHGNEEFDISQIKTYLRGQIDKSDWDKFIELGKTSSIEKSKFSMTALGINLAGVSNGVSKLHGDTASKMWSEIYDSNSEINSMTYVTNGVHLNSWMSDEIRFLLGSYNYDIDKINAKEIIDIKENIKLNMFEQVRKLDVRGYTNIFFERNRRIDLSKTLIIGFARRFAAYKKADLILHNIERITELSAKSNQKLIFIYSGKAHPKDVDGKKILHDVFELVHKHDFSDSFLFVPDYDINIGRLLVGASDVWLNNPVKPLEACGTSGMKVGLNFGVNLSVSDGWWDEAYNQKNGFSIDGYLSEEEIVSIIYQKISNEIIPMYNSHVLGTDGRWFEIMKQSFLTSLNQFGAERMLDDYVNKLYKI